jgi:hypothetical protein
VILCGALLFTSAVEWLGHRLGLGTGRDRDDLRRARLAGGLLAYAMLHRRGRFERPAVVAWFALYGSFIVIVATG